MILESKPNEYGGFTVTLTYEVDGVTLTDTFNTTKENLEKMEYNLLQTHEGEDE